ncbi:hypothetical protein KIS4809_5591 [Bacillus sp. ZZV12-4809]|nr:hypothetical protein KIS4809_5591 [Bacillus sp. ZZV12-4809]
MSLCPVYVPLFHFMCDFQAYMWCQNQILYATPYSTVYFKTQGGSL